ncbi:MAG TPA: nuclear transport factor 2 family protein [Acidimicrobiales bacterium]
MPSTEDWLRDLEELRALVQRYSRAIDARDIDAVAELFDPEGTVDGVRGSSSVADYLSGLRQATPAGTSMHVLGDPLIELEPGADSGTIDTYAVVHQIGAQGAGTHTMLGVRYLDEVVRVPHPESLRGRWVIRRRRTTLVWSRALPGGEPA